MSRRILRPNTNNSERVSSSTIPSGKSVEIGDYSLVIPGNWSDRTIFTFVAPRIVNPLESPHLKMKGGFRDNFSISRERVSGISPKEFLERQLQELKPRLYKFFLLDSSPFSVRDRSAYTVSYQFTLRQQGIDLVQVRVAIAFPDEMILIVGTSAAAVFESKRELFLQIARSINENRRSSDG